MSQTAVVIGGGIVGLHVAHLLHQKSYEVYLLDKDERLGEQTSGRNSGVIHAGIFYKPGSLKEQTCIEGNRLTYEWLRQLNVTHRSCGKWVVPEEGQEDQLGPFFRRLQEIPIPDIQLMTAEALREQEPQIRATEAIQVPSTGIVDAAAYVTAMATFVMNEGVDVLTYCEVEGVVGQLIKTSRGEMAYDIAVNCAGLFSDKIAGMAGLEGYEIRPCRGDYYIINRDLLTKPVYHLPYQGAHGLGVHMTPTLDGQILVGPNAFFIDEREDYRHRSKPAVFEQAVQFYLPNQNDLKLNVAYSGNRPKLFKKGEPVGDFVIERKGDWIHLLGIESPGLTAAPALAQKLVDQI